MFLQPREAQNHPPEQGLLHLCHPHSPKEESKHRQGWGQAAGGLVGQNKDEAVVGKESQFLQAVPPVQSSSPQG